MILKVKKLLIIKIIPIINLEIKLVGKLVPVKKDSNSIISLNKCGIESSDNLRKANIKSKYLFLKNFNFKKKQMYVRLLFGEEILYIPKVYLIIIVIMR